MRRPVRDAKKVVPRPPRNSNYLSQGLKQLNAELRRYTPSVEKYDPVTKVDLQQAFDRFKGHCAHCGWLISLHRNTIGPHGTLFRFYIPLRSGGRATTENIIPVCPKCFVQYAPKIVEPGRIPGVDAIPDLIEALCAATWERERKTQLKDFDLGDVIDRIRAIKQKLNRAFEDMALCLHYRVVGNLRVPDPEIVEGGKNDLAQQIDNLSQGRGDTTGIHKNLKQLVQHAQYKVVTNYEDQDRKRLVRDHPGAGRQPEVGDEAIGSDDDNGPRGGVYEDLQTVEED